MSNSPSLGFGGFLVGLGVGWFVFTTFDVTSNLFAWLMIIGGAAVVVSSLVSRTSFGRRTGGLVGGVIGGLILSLVFTTGFGFIDMFDGGSLGTYRAETTESFTGAMTADSIYLSVDNFNGPVSVSAWDRSEYSVELLIKAKGTTTSQAEKNLEDFVIDFDESVVQGQGRLVLGYGILETSYNKYSVQVEVFLPADAVVDLELESSNGAMSLKDLVGDEIQLDTSNGAFTFDNVYAESINAETSNGAISGDFEAPDTFISTSNGAIDLGAISGDFEAPDTFISTSNGAIDLTLPCTVTGEYILRTSNGQVDLSVSSSSDVGYDLDASTSNGVVSIGLPNLDYSVNQRTSKEARTVGFEAMEIQITLDVSASNGSMDIDD
jgi:hypothetical protein